MNLVQEEDEAWEFDTMLQVVSQEMQVDMEEEEKEKPDADNLAGDTAASSSSKSS